MNVQKYRLEMVREESILYKAIEDKKVMNMHEVAELLNKLFRLKYQSEEVMVMLVLDIQNNILGAFEVSRGGINESIASAHEIFKRALLCNGSRIILGHNHPSGSIRPSKDDIKVTRKLVEGAKLLNMQIVDHVIITENDFSSVMPCL